ncbi:hypothetical protein [Amycolatopsis sp. NPDC059657]|uniref:hypothetical protein n=1 Tax=Amycolatopsis sp. NPDC059657 TaxID=3346899 RepID=UPI003671DAE8
MPDVPPAEPCEFEAGQRIAFTFSDNVYNVTEVVDHQVTYRAAADEEDCTTSPCHELKPHVEILTGKG